MTSVIPKDTKPGRPISSANPVLGNAVGVGVMVGSMVGTEVVAGTSGVEVRVGAWVSVGPVVLEGNCTTVEVGT